jgi:hypothetical protein
LRRCTARRRGRREQGKEIIDEMHSKMERQTTELSLGADEIEGGVED